MKKLETIEDYQNIEYDYEKCTEIKKKGKTHFSFYPDKTKRFELMENGLGMWFFNDPDNTPDATSTLNINVLASLIRDKFKYDITNNGIPRRIEYYESGNKKLESIPTATGNNDIIIYYNDDKNNTINLHCGGAFNVEVLRCRPIHNMSLSADAKIGQQKQTK